MSQARGVASLRESTADSRSPSAPRDQAKVIVRHDASADDCRAFLTQRGGSIYQRPEWDRVFRLYGLETLRLSAWRGESLVGLLPLVWQMNSLLGRRLISLPWFDTAGIVAEDETVRDQLLAAAREAAQLRQVPSVELRQSQAVEGWPQGDADKALLRLQLPQDPDELWRKLSAKVRNQVRKGEKSGLTVELSVDSRSALRLVPEFYEVYATNMRDMGSPSHSLQFMTAVAESFPDECRLAIVRLDGRAIGGGLTLSSGRSLEIPWASSLRSFGPLCVNHVMYWHLLRDACLAGCEWFHFGRSTINSGPYRFKKQWGADAVPLVWHIWRADATAGAPRHDRKLQLASRVWQRLPLSVARRLGPHLIRHLP
ncbi:MAG: FemAB family XrtA/PEP-CTERM system-associated protein [Pirellulales bacterium]